MENSNMMQKSSSRPNEHLGVNKMGKNIKKSPLHQPNNLVSSSTNSGGSNCSSNSNATPPRQQPPHQPQVYNISKSDFRSVVQRLTGSPLHSQEPYQPPPPRPPPSSSNPPKPPSNRLHRVRPPPLGPIHRPPIPNIIPGPVQPQQRAMAPQPHHPHHVPYNNIPRPLPYGQPQFGPPSPMGMPAAAAAPPAESHWGSPALSPISAYMQQLQSCINDPSGRTPSPHPHWQQFVPGQAHWPVQQAQAQPQQFQTGNHHHPPHPQFQASHMQMQAPHPGPGLLHNPPPMPPPHSHSAIPSPRMNGPPALLPSPNSQFLLPSPTMPSPGSGFFNLLSPVGKASYPPLLSPGSQFPPPLSPNFSFSLPGQSGILGPGPPSPGFFPLSPSGFFPISSPRWRDP